jgi:hypothetical protein
MALVNFLNTTTQEYRATKEAHDLIYHKRQWLKLLRDKGSVKTGLGGTQVVVPIETHAIGDAAGTSVGVWDGGNQALTYASDSPLEGMTFDWKYAFCYTFVVDSEKVMNKGAEQWISIMKSRVNAVTKRLSMLIEKQWLYDGTGIGTAWDGIPTFMNNTNATYGGGVDLTSATYGPLIVALGAPIGALTLDHINQAFSLTQDGEDHFDAIISNRAFLQQMRTLVMPAQNQNSGGGTWTWGPLGLNWFGVCPVYMTRYLDTSVKGSASNVAYCFRMDNIHMEMAYSGDGIEESGWMYLPSTIGTYAYIAKVAVRTYTTDPAENAMVTWTA